MTKPNKYSKKLEESEEGYREVVEHSSDGIALVKGDELLYVNQKFLDIFGYERREEVIGKSIALSIHPDDREMVVKINRLRQTGESAPARYEFKGIRRDGAPVYIEVSAAKITYREEPVSIAYLRDITERRETEEALRRSEANARAIINATTDSIFLLDPDGVVLAINEAGAGRLYLDINKAVGATIFDGLPSDVAQRRKLKLREVCLGKVPVRLEGEQRDRWLDTSFYPVVTDGVVTAVAVHGRDITERKQAEAAIEGERHKFQTLSETAPFGIAMVRDDGTFTYVNSTFKTLFGYDLDEVPDGRTWLKKVCPDPVYRHSVVALWLDDTKNTISGETAPRILAFTCKDGTEKMVSVKSVALDKDATLEAKYVSFFEDVTDRTTAENMLRRSEANARAIINATTDSIFLADPKTGAILAINEAGAERLNLEFDRAVGATVYDSATPEVTEMRRAIFREVCRTKKPIYYEGKHGNKWFDTCHYPVITDGKVTADAVYGRDITERKQAEEALRKSEEKYRAIFENSVEGIFQSTPDGRFVIVNPALARIYGFDSPEEMIEKITDIPHQLYVSREEREQHRKLLEKEGMAQNYEHRSTRRDGAQIWVSLTSRVVRDAHGRTLYYEGTVTDVTRRKLAEEALREEREKFQIVSENAPLGMAMIGQDGAFKYINPRFRDLFGYDLEDIPDGRTWFRKAYPDPVYRHTVIEVWLTIFRDREFHEKQQIFNVTCKDGAIKVVSFLSVALKTGEYIMTCQDVTEWKDAEEKLRVERHRFRALAESAPFGMAFIDSDGIFRYINPKFTEFFGYDLDEIPDGKTWFAKAYPDPDYRHLVISAWVDDLKRLQLGEQRNWVFEVLCKDGSKKTISFVPVQLREGEYAMTCEDITERVRAEQVLQQHHEELEKLVEERTADLHEANKELEAFSYSVSHDLRAPLRAIDGFSRILFEEHRTQLLPEAQRFLQLVRTNAQQMGKLIDDLLTFSRLSRQPLTKQSVAPAEIVHQVLEQLHAMQEGRHVDIYVGDLPLCQSDPSLLKVVYTNLLSNALKFTGKREYALIECGCQDEDSEHVYYVKDNGAGFNMKYVDKLFGVFQRLHRADEYEGTGVGLANVQRIVNRHGGRIWVTSEVDKGATFFFTLEKRGE